MVGRTAAERCLQAVAIHYKSPLHCPAPSLFMLQAPSGSSAGEEHAGRAALLPDSGAPTTAALGG
jgi:hypothetical protein